MKRKKLTASMIALVMSVSLPMTTYAANWYLEDGSVTVNADNSGQTVTQGSGSAVPDEAPVITQRESSVETGNTITIILAVSFFLFIGFPPSFTFYCSVALILNFVYSRVRMLLIYIIFSTAVNATFSPSWIRLQISPILPC